MLALAVLIALAGCGGGGGGGGNDGPKPTTTPAPGPTTTASPAGTPLVVAFTVTATAPLEAVQLTAFYPTAKGGFVGSGDRVTCGTPANGTFTQNDRDDGTLILSVASATPLTFPFQIRCAFAVTPGSQLVSSDISLMVDEVTRNGAAGNPATAVITAAVL
jgi:hypothetical protein